MTTSTRRMMDGVLEYVEAKASAIPKVFKHLIVLWDGEAWCVWPYTNAAKARKAFNGILRTGETRFERVTYAEWVLEHINDTIRLYEVDQ